MNFEQITKNRRSINFFDPDKDLSPEVIKKMVELASNSPSSFNLQPWNLVVLRDRAQKEKLKELAWNQPKIVEAPVTMIVLADREGWKQGHPGLERTWQEMVKTGMPETKRDWFLNATRSLYNWSTDANLAFAAKNAAFFAMSLMYAAVSLGLDSHPMDGFDHEGVKKAFNIPDRYWIPVLLAVGYKKPGLVLDPPKWRKTYEEIVVEL
ncbi:nitroreductase family protein [Desulfobacter postgatei]|uniref:Nitroreductase n=1 Tax=Desulfobacter postgatei 2ac9 TaxID=879212 RepID=I5AZN9_9BACT|nr:nitroreductase family protein [Desulfobacter postgatei]EIM62702.1 nitroreductase [Desulfobacter postgatei 2ac9]